MIEIAHPHVDRRAFDGQVIETRRGRADALRQRPRADHADRAGCGLLHEVEGVRARGRSEEHTSELQSLMRISYAVFCLQKKKQTTSVTHTQTPKNKYN